MDQVLNENQNELDSSLEKSALRLVRYWLDYGDGQLAEITDAHWTPEEIVLRSVNEGKLPDICDKDVGLHAMCAAVDSICVLLEVEHKAFMEAASKYDPLSP